jgi:hypothetical protein
VTWSRKNAGQPIAWHLVEERDKNRVKFIGGRKLPVHERKQQQPDLPVELLAADRAAVLVGANRNLAQAGSDVLNLTWGAAIKSSWSHPRSYEPKSNQATGSAKTDLLHRLDFLLLLGTENPFRR